MAEKEAEHLDHSQSHSCIRNLVAAGGKDLAVSKNSEVDMGQPREGPGSQAATGVAAHKVEALAGHTMDTVVVHPEEVAGQTDLVGLSIHNRDLEAV